MPEAEKSATRDPSTATQWIDRFCSGSHLFAVASPLKFYRLEPFVVDVCCHCGAVRLGNNELLGRENAAILSGTADDEAL
jgi:hypothetical protein